MRNNRDNRGTLDGRRVFVQRGACGVTLRRQCFAIGVTYLLLSLIGLIFSSLAIHAPMQYVETEEISIDFPSNSTQESSNEHWTDKMDEATEMLVKAVTNTAIEILLASMAMLVSSALLIQGIRKDKTAFILPFVVINSIEIAGAFVRFIMDCTHKDVTAWMVIRSLLYISISIYFTLSVHSYYQILRIKKKNVITFLGHEFQQDGSYYRTLEEEREPDTPYTEKAVPMTDSEDRSREHVLFARV